MQRIEKNLAAFLMAGLLFETAPSLTGQQAPQMPAAPSRISVTTELVLVNVVARDKKGNLIRDLKKEDFALLEDGKKQGISTFDFENVDEPLTAGAAEATVSGSAPGGNRSRRRRGQELRFHQDAAGGPDRPGVPGHESARRSGFYRRQAKAAGGSFLLHLRRSPGI